MFLWLISVCCHLGEILSSDSLGLVYIRSTCDAGSRRYPCPHLSPLCLSYASDPYVMPPLEGTCALTSHLYASVPYVMPPLEGTQALTSHLYASVPYVMPPLEGTQALSSQLYASVMPQCCSSLMPFWEIIIHWSWLGFQCSIWSICNVTLQGAPQTLTFDSCKSSCISL